MVVRNCLELLTELSEIEDLIKQEEARLKELGIEVDFDALLMAKLKHTEQGM